MFDDQIYLRSDLIRIHKMDINYYDEKAPLRPDPINLCWKAKNNSEHDCITTDRQDKIRGTEHHHSITCLLTAFNDPD